MKMLNVEPLLVDTIQDKSKSWSTNFRTKTITFSYRKSVEIAMYMNLLTLSIDFVPLIFDLLIPLDDFIPSAAVITFA